MSNAKNFLDFLKDFDFVEIPRIQRDYVQGGEDEKAKDIRKTFVGDLCDAIKEQKNISLDFVYGTVKKIKEESKGCFYPLDGQQRLTTLFLLHWYAALFIDDAGNIWPELQKFSYQTRFSSEQFCKLLFNESVINSVKNNSADQKVSEIIKNDHGYSKFWKYDPTVDSMLNMLDCIQKAVSEKEIIWKNNFSSSITFYVYEITNSQEPDDLYVKMNARGKHLTNFENFKAHLQQWMSCNPDLDYDFKENWKKKMDDGWSRFFWEHKNTGEKLGSDPAQEFIDKPFWVFLNRLSLSAYIISQKALLDVLRLKASLRDKHERKNDVEIMVSDIKNLSMPSPDTYISPSLQKNIFGQNTAMYKTVANVLDLLSSEKTIDPAILYSLWDNTKEKTFSNFFWKINEITRNEQLQFFAFSAYCERFCPEKGENMDAFRKNLQHWMQFFYQICSDLHDEQAFAGAISMLLICLDAMGNEQDVYNYLAQKYEEEFKKENKTKPLAQWHFSVKDPYEQDSPQTIYFRLFGKNKLVETGSTISFQSAAIWHEALKCYLRCRSSNAEKWDELFCAMEKNSTLHGHIHGIISQNDNDAVLYSNAKTRFDNLSDETQKLFSPNHESFIKLLGCIALGDDQTLQMPFSFIDYTNWRSNVITKPDIAEAVCEVLLQPNAEVNIPEKPIWRNMLLNYPALITNTADWDNTVHAIKSYYNDGCMYLFNRGSGHITSGAILLDWKVHKKIADIFKDTQLTPAGFKHPTQREIQDLYISYSADCVLGYGIISSDVRIKFTTTKVVKECQNGEFWVECEKDFQLWHNDGEINTIDFIKQIIAEQENQPTTPETAEELNP